MLRPEDVKISFFKISRCGFYAHAAVQPEFSGIEDVLTQLQMWSDGSDLSATKIFDPSEKLDENPVYLFGIKKKASSWVVVTWNEIPSHETGIPSVPMKAKVGDTKVHMNDLEGDSIPGYATYFWIIPSQNVVATIRFKTGRSGQGAMVSYVGRFMSRYMSYSILGTHNGESAVVGYTDEGDQIPKKVRPFFRTNVFQKPNRLDFIFQNVANIRRVVRRGHVTTTNIVDRDFWQAAVRFVYSPRNAQNVVKERVYVELDYRPTLQELTAMVEAEAAAPEVSGWDDMGFVLDGESDPHWISKEHAAGDFTLNVKRINEEAVDIDSLLQALQDNQQNILNLLR